MSTNDDYVPFGDGGEKARWPEIHDSATLLQQWNRITPTERSVVIDHIESACRSARFAETVDPVPPKGYGIAMALLRSIR